MPLKAMLFKAPGIQAGRRIRNYEAMRKWPKGMQKLNAVVRYTDAVIKQVGNEWWSFTSMTEVANVKCLLNGEFASEGGSFTKCSHVDLMHSYFL